MKKKIFGIKVGTWLAWTVCLAAAFVVWAAVKYMQLGA